MADVKFSEAVRAAGSGHISASNPERQHRLWYLATLPPPIDGQKFCNAAMLARLSRVFAPVLLTLGKSAASKIVRALLNPMILLRRVQRGEVAYLSIPGQLGAWLLLPAVAALRLRGAAIWFHHHSFRPINRGPQAAMRALVACAGPGQQHILLSEGMRDRFAALYLCRHAGRAHTVSNSFLFAPDTAKQPESRAPRPPTLGLMSVLTREKGVFYLLDLFDELSGRVPGLRLVIAGPAREPALLAAIQATAARHPAAFEYRGMVSGDDKISFFQDIDLFVLPTTLVDEAEPLVMIEAYARGVDVFATATGCIPDRIRDPAQILTLDCATDAAALTEVLAVDEDEWKSRRADCHAHVVRLATVGRRQGETMMTRMQGAASDDRPVSWTQPSPR